MSAVWHAKFQIAILSYFNALLFFGLVILVYLALCVCVFVCLCVTDVYMVLIVRAELIKFYVHSTFI